MLFHRNPFSNLKLIMAVTFSALSSILVTVAPFFNEVMGTARLNGKLYLAVIFLPAVPLFIISGVKALLLKKNKIK
ncbi:cation transporting ATPase C-terminal domain-containing protein [Companilactobacillus muriivasis]|uniref:cation transporting ATPase C-terminal domain-containing protein n=1 Tax=Companilactobacillus muriivasis TaxID=3081444 RepID=UPI0030C71BE8